MKNKWSCDSFAKEHRGQAAGTHIPQEMSLSLVGNLSNIVIQVALEENLFEKDQSPLRHRKMSFPLDSSGGCMVVRTICRVSASSNRAEGRIQAPCAAAEETVELTGIRKSLGPLGPKADRRGPMSVHQSYQKLAVLPSPILHLK